jgi:glyoxylase-like metal-dependent hydrolase (beta-lactamase superfamily II)
MRMRMSRREFLAASAGVGAAAVISEPVLARLADDDTFFEWKAVGKSAQVAFGFGGNALVLTGAKGSLLVDCKNSPFGQQLRREVEAIKKPIAFVVNTHHHADHTGGNHAFTKDVEVVAQSGATPRILGQLNRYVAQIKEGVGAAAGKTGKAAEQAKEDHKALYARVTAIKAIEFAPKTTFEKDYELDLGGVKVSLHHYGAGHTDNDLVVHIPSLNVLHTGDLVFNRMHPYVDKDGGADTASWQESLRKAAALCDANTKVIPGHGEICGVEGLKAQIEYFDKMRALVAAAIKAGKTRKEVAETRPEIYVEYGKADFVGLVLGAIYDEMKADK